MIKDGEFSMHEYVLQDDKGNVFETGDDVINRADFDNYGRLITATVSKIRIYKNKVSFIKRNCIEFHLDTLFIKNMCFCYFNKIRL
ncbi:MAG: hypothetical protein ABI543_06295 [Ignavibacteria bacterium]